MTRLASITNNHLALTCGLCSHSALIALTVLIEVFGREATVHHAAANARCTKCLVKGQNTFRIVYVGDSWDAMQGARG